MSSFADWVGLAGVTVAVASWLRFQWLKLYESWPGEKQVLVWCGASGLLLAATVLMFGYLFAWPHLRRLFSMEG